MRPSPAAICWARWARATATRSWPAATCRGRSGEAVIERGLASQWHLHPGDRITVGGPATGGAVRARVVGIAVAPDNVAYPLASGARIWMPYRVVAATSAASPAAPSTTALLWVHDRSQLDVTLEQARAASYGLSGVELRYPRRRRRADRPARPGS